MSKAPVKNADRREAVRHYFEEAGCQTTELKVRGAKLGNLECVLPGESAEQIIVGAHFDMTGGGNGAVDNWSGAAMLPMLYQSLKADKHKYTFRFIAFTDEEKGLIGSTFYANKMTKPAVQSTVAMVNLDSLGMTETKVWESRADKHLVDLLLRLRRAMKLRVEAVNVEQVGSTDQEPFRKRSIPAITFHSITVETWKILHSPRDNADALNLEHYYDTYWLVAAYLAYLDIALAPTKAASTN